MRIRTVKPEFWQNEKLSALPEVVHMAAAALLNYADDEGYFNANPALIKAALFPLREPSVPIPVVLQHLSEVAYLTLGEGHDGRSYGRIIAFGEHQSINKPSASKIKPLAIVWESSDDVPGVVPEDSHWEQGTGNREQECSELALQAVPVDPIARIVCQVPLVDGTEYAVTERDVDGWRLAYPAVDIAQQLHAMRSWCIANKANRKTRTGVLRFVTRWLSRAQDNAARKPDASTKPRRGEFEGVT
jgi:hypothetical protein